MFYTIIIYIYTCCAFFSRSIVLNFDSVDVQVVAITVFFLLTIAYYAFFAPFLGKILYEYIAVGVYSFLVTTYFILSFVSIALSTLIFFFCLTNDDVTGVFGFCSVHPMHWYRPCRSWYLCRRC